MEKTLLVIAPGTRISEDTQVFFLVVAETGELLASHMCSGPGWAYGDLYGNRPERIEKYSERFGEVEVKYLEDTDISEEELLRRNKENFGKGKE